jgi:hypothetical protein
MFGERSVCAGRLPGTILEAGNADHCTGFVINGREVEKHRDGNRNKLWDWTFG